MTLLDHEDALSSARQVVSGDEAVRARADHDGVEPPPVATHVPSFRMRIAASRPDAPMMPPPGCVPEPH